MFNIKMWEIASVIGSGDSLYPLVQCVDVSCVSWLFVCVNATFVLSLMNVFLFVSFVSFVYPAHARLPYQSAELKVVLGVVPQLRAYVI